MNALGQAPDGTASGPSLCVAPNTPLGEGQGIHPGRVAWVHSPGVAAWDGETGLWMEDRWNDQRKADNMVAEALATLAGVPDAGEAWEALFRHFNSTHGNGDRGYTPG